VVEIVAPLETKTLTSRVHCGTAELAHNVWYFEADESDFIVDFCNVDVCDREGSLSEGLLLGGSDSKVGFPFGPTVIAGNGVGQSASGPPGGYIPGNLKPSRSQPRICGDPGDRTNSGVLWELVLEFHPPNFHLSIR
jgi:hypothetical protein